MKRVVCVAPILIGAVLVLAACNGGQAGQETPNPTATPIGSGTATTATPSPVVQAECPKPTACPAAPGCPQPVTCPTCAADTPCPACPEGAACAECPSCPAAPECPQYTPCPAAHECPQCTPCRATNCGEWQSLAEQCTASFSACVDDLNSCLDGQTDLPDITTVCSLIDDLASASDDLQWAWGPSLRVKIMFDDDFTVSDWSPTDFAVNDVAAAASSLHTWAVANCD